MNDHVLTLEHQIEHELTMRQLHQFFEEFGRADLADIGGKGYEDRMALHKVKPTVYDYLDGFDICKKALPQHYARIVCCNTFEHILDPVRAAENITKSLKPEGVLFLTTVFIYPKHDYEGVVDTYRYTDTILELLFADLEKIKCWIEPESQAPNAQRVTYIGRKL